LQSRTQLLRAPSASLHRAPPGRSAGADRRPPRPRAAPARLAGDCPSDRPRADRRLRGVRPLAAPLDGWGADGHGRRAGSAVRARGVPRGTVAPARGAALHGPAGGSALLRALRREPGGRRSVRRTAPLPGAFRATRRGRLAVGGRGGAVGGLRVLITNNALAAHAGSELWVRDVATALLARGHTPIAFSPDLGAVAEELRRQTIPVVDRLDGAGVPLDLIHGQHHLETMTALLRFPGIPE